MLLGIIHLLQQQGNNRAEHILGKNNSKIESYHKGATSAKSTYEPSVNDNGCWREHFILVFWVPLRDAGRLTPKTQNQKHLAGSVRRTYDPVSGW